MAVDPWLLLALLVAAAFRFESITQPLVDAFSWREASTAMMADNFQTRSWNVFFPEVSWTGPGPSYQGREFQITSYIAAVLYQVFGWHDWFGRAISACFGLITTACLYAIALRCWGVWEARGSALMMAILPGATFIDRSFLPDPSMLALVTSGALLFIVFLDRGRMAWLILSGAVVTLGVLAKVAGIAVAVPLLYALVEQMRARTAVASRLFALVAGVGLLCGLAVATYYAWALHLARSYPPYHMAGSGYAWTDGLPSFLRNGFYLPDLRELVDAWYLTWPLLLLSLIGLLLRPPARDDRGKAPLGWFFHAWLLGGTVLFLVAAREIVNNPWNLHILSVPIAAFAGRGLVVAAGLGGSGASAGSIVRAGGICLFLVLVCALPSRLYLSKAYAQTGYELGTELASLSAPGDLVIAVSSTVGDPIAVYYSRRRGWVFPPGGGDTDWSRLRDDSEAISLLEELRAEGAAWLGIAKNARDSEGRRFLEHHKGLLTHLDQSAEIAAETDSYVIYRLR
ncbi:MAG: glycosyltransferase family 39 protein [Hyphomicrobiales bacterium]|nr:MAG: glycosyltransferase family 39 protein [Hyphomicrobiales bacterium]